MKSTLPFIRQRLDACKNKVIKLEEMNHHIKEALDTVPFTPRYRQQIKKTYLRYAKEIAMLKTILQDTEWAAEKEGTTSNFPIRIQ